MLLRNWTDIMPNVKVYGADWCPMTKRTLDFLAKNDVAYEYIDLESDPKASEWVKGQNGGKELKPTVDIDGEVLAEPSNAQLEQALANH